jgi:hypothetical protein
VCHAFLQNPNFLLLLLQIDTDFAAKMRVSSCFLCAGTLHRANYPRKPRCCLDELFDEFSFRFSFCCSDCRKRNTPVSVRFLGRRVYLGLAVVLMSASRTTDTSNVTRLSGMLHVPARTIQRWREWWVNQFPHTTLWQAECARFMPPIRLCDLPDSLIERFVDLTEEALRRLLIFLSPLTVSRLVTLNEVC